MDNLTHSLAGWALGQAGLKTQSRKGLAALILAANMPDIDVFFGSAPWEPLAMHRGFTHSLIGGVVVMPPILFGLLMLLDRWQVGRGTTFKSGLAMRPWWLLALCYIGAISHPLLDLLTTYSVQLLSPFSGAWFHADGLFIIDVWVWVGLAFAIEASRWKEKAGKPWQWPVQAALGLLAVYIAANIVITQRADAAARDWARSRPMDALFASPPPIQSWQRTLVWREGECYRWSSYRPFDGGLGPVTACRPTHLDDPLVRKALRSDPELRGFLRWSVLPMAEVERSQCSAKIAIGDARYREFAGRSRLRRQTIVPTGAPGC